jgi:hypothetical protein
MITAPENTYCADSKGWANTGTDPWGLGRSHERYICTEMCFNVHLYRLNNVLYADNACQNKQKLGYPMSEEVPCTHPGTGEGLGLIEACQNDNLASGRLQ